ncbi:MAG: ABC transporter permease [Candidatus Diapherotrites archaeon]|nr:ABC transporter permease [Candidatus Diapherotrites archaeon]
MNLFNLILKDLRIIVRNPKTVFLITAGPIIMMFLIGLIFAPLTSWDKQQLSAVKVGICDLDGSNLSSSISSSINENFDVVKVAIGDPRCKNEFRKSLEEGGITAEVVIPKGFQESVTNGEHQDIDVYVNNGIPQVSFVTTSIIDGMTARLSKNLGGQFISKVWDSLNNMSQNLENLEGRLDESKHEMNALLSDMDNINSGLQKIDVDKLNSNIQNDKARVSQLKARMSEYQSEVDDYISDIDDLNSNLNSASSTLSKADTDLVNTQNDLIQTREDLQNAYTNGYCDHANDPEFQGSGEFIVQRWVSLCGNVGSILNDLDNIISDINTHRADISELQSEISSARVTLSSARNKLTNLKAQLSDTSEIDQTSAELEETENMLKELTETRNSAQESLSKSRKTITGMSSNIDSLMSDAEASRKHLLSLVGKKPEDVITPLSTKFKLLFPNFRYIDAFFPTIISIVAMLVAILFSASTLIKEKERGTLRRILTSPTRPISIIASKIIVTWFVVLVQTLFLISISVLLFGVMININMLPAILIITTMTIVFSLVGMVNALLSKSENTAILASLVICIPLMFLTGVFFPLEFMTPVVRLMGTLSPLTQAVNALNTFAMYHISLNNLVTILLSFSYLSVWVVVGLVLSTWLLKKA